MRVVDDMSDSYYNGDQHREETRQEYANARVQEWREERLRSGLPMPISFGQLLGVFVEAGKMYDRGVRLFAHEEAA